MIRNQLKICNCLTDVCGEHFDVKYPVNLRLFSNTALQEWRPFTSYKTETAATVETMEAAEGDLQEALRQAPPE